MNFNEIVGLDVFVLGEMMIVKSSSLFISWMRGLFFI